MPSPIMQILGGSCKTNFKIFKCSFFNLQTQIYPCKQTKTIYKGYNGWGLKLQVQILQIFLSDFDGKVKYAFVFMWLEIYKCSF